MSYTQNAALLSTGKATAAQVQAWFEANVARGAGYVGLAPVPIPAGFGQAIVSEAARWAPFVINSDLLAAQAAHESAFAQSIIARTRRNYGGIGAENDDPLGKSVTFATPREGIQAQVAHLLTYCVGEGEWTALDPRYRSTKAAGTVGSVMALRDLEQKWAWTPQAQYDATPQSKRYGAMVAALANQLIGTEAPPVATGDDPRFAYTPDTSEFGYPQGIHGRNGVPIELFILHITVGTDSQGWLLGGNGSSTHYLTNHDGTPRAQHVREADAAWTPGNKAYALRSVNLEQELLSPAEWTDAIMRELAKTCAPILKRNNIPAVYLGTDNGPGKRGMCGHVNVPNPKSPSDSDYCGPWGGSNCHTDPGATFDWPRFTSYVQAELDALAGITPADETHPLWFEHPDQEHHQGELWPFPYRLGFRAYVEDMGAHRYPADHIAGLLSLYGYPEGEEYRAVDGNSYIITQRMILQFNPHNSAPFDIVPLPRETEPPEAA